MVQRFLHLPIGVNDFAGLAGEATLDAVCRGLDGYHHRAAFAFDEDIHRTDTQQVAFDVGGESGDVGVTLAEFQHEQVHVGAVGLHDVVGETVGIVAVVVVNAERGQQSRGDQCASHHGTDNGVTVVEEVVGRVALLPTDERGVAEDVAPIICRRTPFEIVGVAGTDGLRPSEEVLVLNVLRAQDEGLSEYFGGDGLLPHLLAEGFGGVELLAETLALEVVPVQGEEESDGVMAVVAGNDGDVVVEEFRHKGLCDSDLFVIQDDHADVLDGNGTHALLAERVEQPLAIDHLGDFDDHLLEAEAQVGGVSETEDALNHGSMEIMLPKRSTRMGIQVSFIISPVRARANLLSGPYSFLSSNVLAEEQGVKYQSVPEPDTIL